MKKLIAVIAVLLLLVGCAVVNGCVSAVYKRQGSALKLVSQGEGINNVTEKI